jgi:ATP-dependent phosphoenolpyruvate carboxykinase
MGILPAMGKLTREQATIFLLLGYASTWNESENCEYPTISYLPFYNSDLSIYSRSLYAGLLYEKLERSQSECWVLNTMPVGPNASDTPQVDLKLLRKFVLAIESKSAHQIAWQSDRYWRFESVSLFSSYPKEALNPEKAWAEEGGHFLELHQRLKESFRNRLSRFERELTQNLRSAAELFVN